MCMGVDMRVSASVCMGVSESESERERERERECVSETVSDERVQ